LKSKRKEKGMISTPLLFLSRRHTSIRRVSTLTEIINKRLNPELDSIRQAGTWKTERIISTSQSSHIKVENSKIELLNFCANNYLGLANNSQIIKSAKQALDQYGASLSSVRFICGTQTIHKQRKINIIQIKKQIFYLVEQRIAKFHQ
jgi:glycine C-acetyltransferase